MTSADFKPGDIVEHPMWGNGVVAYTKFGLRVIGTSDGYECIFGLTGWERVETVRPGHVQVRVDDLDPQTLSEWSQYAGCNLVETALLRVGCASIARQAGQGDPTAQRAESTPPADEQDASATEAATYQCPWCSTDVTFSLRLDRHPGVGVMVWVAADGGHACPPAQPDEPQEFGAKATVAQADGHIERWLNMHAPPQGRRGWLTWDARDTAGSTPGQSKWADWGEIIQRGTATLGWDE